MKMRALLLASAIWLALPSPAAFAQDGLADARAVKLAPWRGFIIEASRRFGIPENWIGGVIMAESAGQAVRDGQPITSRAGAMGLMQLMPSTFEDMRNLHGLGDDPYDPRDNILAGTAYLRAMYERFGYPGLFGAYNAGPERYQASLQGLKLPPETRAYLAQLTQSTPQTVPETTPGMTVFVGLPRENSTAITPQNSPLFVPLNPAKPGEN
jgi:soluble lytic murein transglycosylase-like protein